MLQTIFLVVMIVISIALAGVILIQRSEGGALGMGGGPSGFMTARGAGNLLTRTTWVLATLFFLCAIGLTITGNISRSNQSIVDAAAMNELAGPPVAGQTQAPADASAAATPVPAQPAAPSLQDFQAAQSGAAPAEQPAPAQPAPAR